MTTATSYKYNASEFSFDEREALIFFLEVEEPQPGIHHVDVVDHYFDIKVWSTGKVAFQGRSCPTCLSEPDQPCNPDCPELG